MDLDGFGDEYVERFVQEGYLQTVADFWPEEQEPCRSRV